MIENIEYIEEEVVEEIFEGTYILDGLRMNEEHQRKKIFNLMKAAGVEVPNPDEIEIGYEGADDDYGISETQSTQSTKSTKFTVFRKFKKKVPYKVTREEIFEGTYILDRLRMTEEQQRNKIFELMRVAGVEMPNFEDIEIGYEDADDDYGISETQSTKFVVYKKIRTRLEDSEVRATSDDMSQVLADLKELREKLDSASDEITREDILTDLIDRTDSLEKILYNANNNELTAEIDKIDEELKRIEKQLKEAIKQYEESYEKMRAILKEQNEKLESMGILDDSEYEEIKLEYFDKKVEENEKALAIKKEIDIRKKQISSLKRRKNAIKKDLLNATALGISIEQYQNITSTLEKRKLVNAIFEKKGLNNIVLIPYKERTKLQKQMLKDAKEEIIKEVAELQKNSDGEISVIDAIEALYNIDYDVVMVKKPRGIKVTPEALDNMKNNVLLLPEKFVDHNVELNKDDKLDNVNVNANINVTKAPEDMLEAHENLNNEGYHEEVVRDVVFEGSIVVGEEDLYEAIIRDFGIDVRDNDEFEVEYDGASTDEAASDIQILNYRIVKLSKKMVKDDINELDELNEILDDEDEYEEITEREAVFNGELIIGEEDVYDVILRDFGIDIRGNDEYEIGFEGEDDRYSDGEAQTTKFTVYKITKKLVKKPKPKPIDDPNPVDDEEDENTQNPDIEYDDENPLIERITLYVDADNNGEVYGKKYLFDRFNMNFDSDPIRIDGALCYRISQDDVDFILQNATNEMSPYKIRVREIHLGKRDELDDNDTLDSRLAEEKVTLFIDTNNNNEIYGRSYIFERFNIEPTSDEVRIDGALCYRMSGEDANYIISNQNNDVSPYVVEQREIALAKRNDGPEGPELPHRGDDDLGDGLQDRYTIFVDGNGKQYVRKNVFERFNIDPVNNNEVRIDGALCYEISEDDVDNIVNNKDNDYSPYLVRFNDVNGDSIERPKTDDPTPEVDDENGKGGLGSDVVDQITVFRDLDNDNRLYVRKNTLTRFNIKPISEEVRIDGAACYEISNEDFESIMNNQNNDYSPYKVRIKDVNLGKTHGPVGPTPGTDGPIGPTPGTDGPIGPTPGTDGTPGTGGEGGGTDDEDDDDKVREIPVVLYRDVDTNNVYAAMNVLNLYQLTPGSVSEVIDGKQCFLLSDADHNKIKTFEFKNVKVNLIYKDVKLEKKTTKHYGRHVEEIIDDLTSNLDIHANDGKNWIASKETTLDELSEEELEVLFTEYRGSLLKTDMNNQINPVILAKLREYGLSKVNKLNDEIKAAYAKLFALLGQIKSIEDAIGSSKDKNIAQAYMSQRETLLDQAAECAESIMDNIVKANNILSGGVHGLEEDFKAVASKMNYVGFRFGKNKHFNNELQHQLGEHGRQLREALNNRDSEGIVDHFMALETLYYDNTEIRGSIFGKRSVGDKYYSPIAEQFDYRDDPFIRDLLTTVAVTSAAVSAVNAIRVERMIKNNQDVMDQVHKAADDITGKSDTMQAGMEAQAHQTVLNTGNEIERTELDYTGWNFGNVYHAADAQGHAFYNQFNTDVQNQINSVTQQYASGAISQADALKAMAQISNDAQATLSGVTNGCIGIFRQYAQTHPQFDLTAIEQSMAYITAHPDAIVQMNNGIVDIMATAESLKSLSLDAIPSDLLTTLICACSATSLALNVSRTMEKKYTGKVEYGNEVTDMMDDYVRQTYGSDDEYELDEDLEDENTNSHGR